MQHHNAVKHKTMKYFVAVLLLICSFNLSAQTIQSVVDTSQKGKQTIIHLCTPNRYNARHPPLYVIFYKNKTIAQVDTDSVIKKISPNDIKAIHVLKGDSAIKKYGEKAKNGVIEIDLKYRKDKGLFE